MLLDTFISLLALPKILTNSSTTLTNPVPNKGTFPTEALNISTNLVPQEGAFSTNLAIGPPATFAVFAILVASPAIVATLKALTVLPPNFITPITGFAIKSPK